MNIKQPVVYVELRYSPFNLVCIDSFLVQPPGSLHKKIMRTFILHLWTGESLPNTQIHRNHRKQRENKNFVSQKIAHYLSFRF